MDGENNGIPEYPIKMDDLGGKPTIFGNIQMVKLTAVAVCWGIARAKTPVTSGVFLLCSIAIQFLWRKPYQPLVFTIHKYMPKRFG